LGVRKWNRDLTLAENVRSNAKQPVVRLNTFSLLAWSLLWVLASFLAAIDFDRERVITYFLVGPWCGFLAMALLTYAVLRYIPLTRGVVAFEAEAAANGGLLQMGVTICYFVAWLPFVRTGDPAWVAATSWIATPVAALAGFQASVGLLALAGRIR
jgi:hypothetical protein